MLQELLGTSPALAAVREMSSAEFRAVWTDGDQFAAALGVDERAGYVKRDDAYSPDGCWADVRCSERPRRLLFLSHTLAHGALG